MFAVADVMTPEPVCIRATSTLRDAVREVVSRGLRHLPVTDERGRLVALVHDFQLFRHCRRRAEQWEIRPDHAQLPVLRAAVSVGRTAEPATPLGDVLPALADGWDDAVVVLDGACRPVGLFTVADALRLAPGWLAPWSQVRQAVTTRFTTFDVATPIRDALRRLWEEQRPHALVREGVALAGTISLRELVAFDPRAGAMLADVMAREPVRAVGPETSLVEATRALAADPRGCLPVLVDRRPRGLFTQRDVLRTLRRTIEQVSDRSA